MNPFADRYRKLSNADLLKVVDHPGDYQPIAVEAAEAELLARNPGEQEMLQAKAENDLLKHDQQTRTEKKIAFENKVRDIGMSISDVISPIQKTPPSINRIIASLSIVFGALFLIEFSRDFDLIKFMLTNKEGNWGAGIWGAGMLLYFLPIVLLPAAIFLFWRRKKTGWVLFAIFLGYSALEAILVLYFILKETFTTPRYPDMTNLLPPSSVSPQSAIWSIFFFGGCIWLLLKKEIRKLYQIDRRAMILSMTVAVVLVLISVVAR